MKKPKLIPDWRKLHKMRSAQVFILIAVLNTAPVVWGALIDRVPLWIWALVNTALGIAGLYARAVAQPSLKDDDEA